MLGLTTLALLTAVPAHAQYYNHGHQNGHQNGHGSIAGPLVGGFIGGAIVGGIIGNAMAPPPVVYVRPAPPQVYQPCWQEFLYYDNWNRPVYRTVCR